MEEIRDMLCEELDNIAEQGEITTNSLDIIDKLTHSIKSIDTIMAMEEANYGGYRRGSYSKGHRGTAKSTGRYSRHERMMNDEEM